MTLAHLAASFEERLLVPTYGSRWPFAPIAAHRGLSLPLQLTGAARASAATTPEGVVRVVGIGRAKLIAPLVARLFGGAPGAPVGGRRALWSPAALAPIDADVVVAEVHRWAAPRFRRAGWLVVPDAVRWVGELSEVPGPAPSHSLRADLRKVAGGGFTLTQTTDPADWAMFVTRMVVPQARARFGAEAWVPSHRFLEELRRAGVLHLVRRGDESVAGVCTVASGDTLWFPVSGVRDGDPALFRSGASLATLALPIEWARSRGFRRVDLGRTSPFLRDGVHQLKRKWGLRPAADPLGRVMAVRVGPGGARLAFAREPLLVEVEDGLRPYRGEAP